MQCKLDSTGGWVGSEEAGAASRPAPRTPSAPREFGREGAQVGEQLRVGDHSRHLVLAAEAAAAAHPFGKPARRQHADFGGAQPVTAGAMRLVIEVAPDQVAVDRGGEDAASPSRDRALELDDVEMPAEFARPARG